VPKDEWPADVEAVAGIRRKREERLGNAGQALVLAGMDIDMAALRALESLSVE